MVAAQLLDRAAFLVRARNQLDAELTRTVRRADLTQAAEHDGLASMKSWLRGHVRLSAGEVRRLIGNGRALERLPAVAAAFAAGGGAPRPGAGGGAGGPARGPGRGGGARRG